MRKWQRHSISQNFDNGHKIKITPFTEQKLSLWVLSFNSFATKIFKKDNLQGKKQSQIHLSFWMLLFYLVTMMILLMKEILDKQYETVRSIRNAELCWQTIETKMVHQLQQTDISIKSVELKIPRECPSTSIFQIVPKEYDDFFWIK